MPKSNATRTSGTSRTRLLYATLPPPHCLGYRTPSRPNYGCVYIAVVGVGVGDGGGGGGGDGVGSGDSGGADVRPAVHKWWYASFVPVCDVDDGVGGGGAVAKAMNARQPGSETSLSAAWQTIPFRIQHTYIGRV